MTLRNGPDSYGLVSRILHWTMAAAILGMLGFGTWLARMEPRIDTIWLYGAHKSTGMVLFAMVLVRLAWHRVSPPPAPLPAPRWKTVAARASHALVYLLLAAVPLTGWIASAATGLDVVVFGRWTLPRIAPVSEAWENGFLAAHGLLTKALLGLLVIHVGAALTRRDGTLARMSRGRAA